MTTPDQTNAEVSDERLRECPFCGVELEVRNSANAYGRHPKDSDCIMAAYAINIPHDVERWNRRSVTSQASEGAGPDALATAVEALKEWLAIWDAVCNEADPDEGVPPDWSIARLAMMPWMDPLGFDTAEYFSGYMKADLVYRARDLVHAWVAPVSKRVERLETIKECATIAHTAHLQCVDERDRIRQNTPEFGYAQAKVEAVTAVWHRINELLPKEPSSAQALQGGRS